MTKIKVFSTNSCPYCTMVKDFLTEKNIEFEDVNVGEDQNAANEMVAKSGQMGVPVVEIDGQIVVGFNKEKINSLLG